MIHLHHYQLLLEQLEQRFSKRIQVKSVSDYHLEQFDVMER